MRFALVLLAAPLWAAADPQLLALMPPDAKVIAGFDVTGAKASPLGQFLLTRFGDQKELSELDAATGFDPRTDIAEVVGAGSGASNDVVVAVRGSFEPARLQQMSQTVGVHRGVTLIGGPDGMAAAFLNGNTALAGTRVRVEAAIDRWVDGATATGALSGEATRISATMHLWAACNDFSAVKPPEGIPNDPQMQMMQNLLATLVKVSGGVKFGETIDASTQITARTADDAKGLADLLKLLVGLAPPNSPVPVTALTFAAEGDTVNVSLSIPQTAVEQIIPH